VKALHFKFKFYSFASLRVLNVCEKPRRQRECGLPDARLPHLAGVTPTYALL